MRILAITNLYPNSLQPNRGTFNRQQLRALADRNQVRIIAPIAWTDERRARRKTSASLSQTRVTICDGLHVEHPRYLFPPCCLRRTYGACFRESIRGAFERACKEFVPDLVLAAWAYPDGWAACDLAHRVGLPVVVKVHGSDILTLTAIRGRARGTAEAVRRADRVIAVSRDLAEHVMHMGADPHRIDVAYDGVDVALFHPGKREDARRRLGLGHVDEPLVLFVGNLVHVKGIDILIQAIARLKNQRPVRCYLIGQGPLRSKLERQVAFLGLSDRVTFAGPVAHATLPDWFRAADVFVLPSRSEGVPCVLLEAAACGTPYVATRVGGIPEIAHLNHGELVAKDDPAALAAAVVNVLDCPRPALMPVFSRTHADAAAEIDAICERALIERSARGRSVRPLAFG